MRSNHFTHKKRFPRFIRLLKRLRPLELPVTHRHNRVELFPGGRQFFEALFEAIHYAEHTILLEYYLIHNDQVGSELANELADAVQRGVTVKLIYDYIGCLDTPTSYFRNLAKQGVKLYAFNVPSFKRAFYGFVKRDHRKMTIVDGTLAFLGGLNIGDEYAGFVTGKQSFRDLGFSIRGEAISELEAIFHETWNGDGHETAVRAATELPRRNGRNSGDAAVNIISGSPRQRRFYIREAFQVNIASAAEEILIATPYFVPGPRIIRYLLRAARRGVRV